MVCLGVLREVGQQKQELRLNLPPARPSKIGWYLLIGLGVVLPILAIAIACFIGFAKPEDDNAFLASLLFLSFSAILFLNYFSFPAGLREFAMVYQTTLDSFLV